jgi:hypothetical protein
MEGEVWILIEQMTNVQMCKLSQMTDGPLRITDYRPLRQGLRLR